MNLIGDLRYSFRRLAKSPAFTLAAVASLAVGIGATTAIYSIVHTLLVRPLAGIAEPERLVDIGRTEGGNGFDTFGYPDLVDYQQQSRTLDRVFGYTLNPYLLRADRAAERVLGYAVSATYFEALGVTPEVGRFFNTAEDSPKGGAPVAVVSDAYFRRVLGGDPAKIGSILHVDSRPLTLVGVTPPGFEGHIFGLAPQVYVPLTTPLSDEPWQVNRLTSREGVWLLAGGRLAPGATLAAARAEIRGIAARISKAYPESHAERGADVLPARPVPGIGRTPVRWFSSLMFGLVGLVLVIACMNVASMLLARAEERRREIAVRQALGAGGGRIVGQLLTETALLFALAVGPALLLARWSAALLAALRPPTPFPVRLDFPLDWTAAGFALAVALATGIVFGLTPALRAARSQPLHALHDGTSGAGTRQLRLRRVLVGAQIALSLVLLVAASLLTRALATAQRIDPGFRTAGVVAYEFNFDLAGYPEERARRALTELVEGARRLPGVTAASAARVVPLDLSRMSFGGVAVAGFESPSKWGFDADANVVAPGFFSTLDIPLEGRDFDAGDRAGGDRVAIVNQTFAERFFPQGAVGRGFDLIVGRDQKESYRIVGVARDIQSHALGDEPKLFYWLAASQAPVSELHLLVRATAGTSGLDRAVETLARNLDPDLPPGPPRPLAQVAATSTLPQRLAASVAGSVGSVGLFLAAVGLYGVVAFVVAARRRELAVRIALGARREDVLRFVLSDAARPVVGGVVAGLVLALALSRLISSLLFGLSPSDLVTFAGVPLVLGAVALAAVALPARRATRIDPAEALRSE